MPHSAEKPVVSTPKMMVTTNSVTAPLDLVWISESGATADAVQDSAHNARGRRRESAAEGHKKQANALAPAQE